MHEMERLIDACNVLIKILIPRHSESRKLQGCMNVRKDISMPQVYQATCTLGAKFFL